MPNNEYAATLRGEIKELRRELLALAVAPELEMATTLPDLFETDSPVYGTDLAALCLTR